MRARPPKRRAGAAWAALVLLGAASGCAGVGRVPPGSLVELGEEQGLVAIHTDSPIEIESMSAGSLYIGTLPPGPNVRLYVARAGSYRWARINLRERGDFLHWRWRLRNRDGDERWAFRVKAGHINYPGQVSIRHAPQLGARWIASRTINRSAVLFEALTTSHAELLRRYPLVYTGRTRDDFLAEHWADTFGPGAVTPAAKAVKPETP